jgi:hypothetical protein
MDPDGPPHVMNTFEELGTYKMGNGHPNSKQLQQTHLRNQYYLTTFTASIHRSQCLLLSAMPP